MSVCVGASVGGMSRVPNPGGGGSNPNRLPSITRLMTAIAANGLPPERVGSGRIAVSWWKLAVMLCVVGGNGADTLELGTGVVESAASDASDTGGGAGVEAAATAVGWVTPANSGNCAGVPVLCAHGKLRLVGGVGACCACCCGRCLPCIDSHPCMSVFTAVVDACAVPVVPNKVITDVDGGGGEDTTAGIGEDAGAVAGVPAAGWVTPASSGGCAGVVIGV